MDKPKPWHHTPTGFRNLPGAPEMTITPKEMRGFLWRMLRQGRKRWPVPEGHVLPRERAEAGWREQAGQGAALMWLGHAAFLLRIGSKTLLLDPYLGEEAGPVRGLSPRRFVPPAFAPGNLPKLDAVLLSHNHYDHLCAETMAALPGKADLPMILPLKLGDWFAKRGFRNIHELDWHDRIELGDVSITALPAIHWSKRTAFDTNRSLWAGFLIEAEGLRVFFSGDTAYGPMFADIGERYGPIDYALVPIGAYEPAAMMRAHHTNPEEAVALGRDIGARRLVAMHWGTVMLTDEHPFEPAGRFRRAAEAAGYGEDAAWIMAIGETRPLRRWPEN